MANWTQNSLVIHGENATQLMQSLLTDDEEFDFNKIIPLPIDIEVLNVNSDWMSENWDTGSNAIETSVYDNKVSFQSKWNNVCMLISTLSKQHSKFKFEYEFADEEPGSNAGWMIYQNGEVIECKEFAAFSKECFEKYFELCGDDDEYKFDEKRGTYVGIYDCDYEDDADNDDCDEDEFIDNDYENDSKDCNKEGENDRKRTVEMSATQYGITIKILADENLLWQCEHNDKNNYKFICCFEIVDSSNDILIRGENFEFDSINTDYIDKMKSHVHERYYQLFDILAKLGGP